MWQKKNELIIALAKQEKKVIEVNKSRELLNWHRDIYSRKMSRGIDYLATEEKNEWRAHDNACVAVYNPDDLAGDIVVTGTPHTYVYGREGVDANMAYPSSKEQTKGMVPEYSHDVIKCHVAHVKHDESVRQAPVPVLLELLEKKNVVPERVWLRQKASKDWRLDVDAHVGLATEMEQRRKDDLVGLVADEREIHAMDVLYREWGNEQSVVGQLYDISKPFSNGGFTYLWDLHNFAIANSRDVLLSVAWNAATNCVERVLILNDQGQCLMDEKIDPGAQYDVCFYLVRKRAYMFLVGSNIYGFNVFQHLSKIGFGGQRTRCVDLSALPCLKGVKPSLSIEKSMLLYGIDQLHISSRLDPMYDNAVFGVFMLRRDGVGWRTRRKTKG